MSRHLPPFHVRSLTVNHSSLVPPLHPPSPLESLCSQIRDKPPPLPPSPSPLTSLACPPAARTCGESPVCWCVHGIGGELLLPDMQHKTKTTTRKLPNFHSSFSSSKVNTDSTTSSKNRNSTLSQHHAVHAPLSCSAPWRFLGPPIRRRRYTGRELHEGICVWCRPCGWHHGWRRPHLGGVQR